MNYTSKIVYINHLYSVYFNILQIRPQIIEIRLAPKLKKTRCQLKYVI